MDHPVCYYPRMKLLFTIMEQPVPSSKDLKKEAKKIKSFLVLIKKKLQRQQVCRSRNFRKLMALVFDPNEEGRVWQTYIAACPSFVIHPCYIMSHSNGDIQDSNGAAASLQGH